MKTPKHYQIKWNGYTVEVDAYVDRCVELESIEVLDDNGIKLNEVELLSMLTPSRGNTVKDPITELENLVLEAEAENRQEIAEGTYFSSCD